MRYLALLRDSYREARDSKVIYFTVGLSLFVILNLLTVSFRPVTVEEEADFVCGIFNWTFSMEATGKANKEPATCEVTNCKQVNDAPNFWEGDYECTVIVKFPKKVAGSEEAKEKLDQIKAVLQARLSGLGLKNLNIQQSVSGEGDQVVFLITNQGTRVKNLRDWTHEPSWLFGAVPMSWLRASLNGAVYVIEDGLINNIGGWVIVLIGVIVTAFFIPNMLQKGTVDLLLVKPVFRFELLLVKYIGGLSFVFLNSVVAIGGVWLVLGLRTGIWAPGFLLTIVILTFFFAILYAVSALFAVLTRSSVLCIFMACLVWLALFLIGIFDAALYRPESTDKIAAEKMVPTDEKKNIRNPMEQDATLRAVGSVVHVFYTILPRTRDLGQLTTQVIAADLLPQDERKQSNIKKMEVSELSISLGVSLAFIAVLLGLGCWRFTATDY